MELIPQGLSFLFDWTRINSPHCCYKTLQQFKNFDSVNIYLATDPFYQELNRIYGSQNTATKKSGAIVIKKSQHFAKFTRSFVYEPLENGAVLEDLDKLRPYDMNAHAWLCACLGKDALERKIGMQRDELTPLEL